MRHRTLVSVVTMAVVVAGAVGCGDGTEGGNATTGKSQAAASCAGFAKASPLSVEWGGGFREITVHIAPAVAAERGTAPVLIGIHGYSGTGAGFLGTPGLADAIDAAGFVAVFPDGLSGGWSFPGYDYAGGSGAAGRRVDRVFFHKLIDRIEQLGCVDPERIYVVGSSMGAGMASELTCTETSRIAGVALVADEHFVIPCPDAAPMPVISLHALDDKTLPYGGGRLDGDPKLPRVQPMPEVLAAWARRNGCDPAPRTSPVGKGGTELRYTGCTAPVVHLRIAHGGHAWFGVGENASGISATKVVMAFLTGLDKRSAG